MPVNLLQGWYQATYQPFVGVQSKRCLASKNIYQLWGGTFFIKIIFQTYDLASWLQKAIEKKIWYEDFTWNLQNYTAGTPTPVLYIKNLAKDIVPDDFYYIFGELTILISCIFNLIWNISLSTIIFFRDVLRVDRWRSDILDVHSLHMSPVFGVK